MSGWRVAEVAKDIERAAAAIGSDTVDVLAHSAGCSAALLFVASNPHRIGRLVLITPSPRGLPDAVSDADRIRSGRRHEPPVAAAIAARERMMTGAAEPDEIEALVAAMNPMFYGEWNDRARRHAAAEPSQVHPVARAEFYGPEFSLDAAVTSLRSCAASVLVLTGEFDGATGIAPGAHIAALFPDATHTTLEGCGHFPWVDHPERFRTTVEAFLSG